MVNKNKYGFKPHTSVLPIYFFLLLRILLWLDDNTMWQGRQSVVNLGDSIDWTLSSCDSQTFLPFQKYNYYMINSIAIRQ